MKTLVTITGLSKAYGNQVLFERAKLTISENQKIAIIGRNGAGKSTLIRILTGEEEADSGSILIHPGVTIGYLRQQDIFLENELVLDYLVRISEKEEWQCGKAAYQFGLTTDYLYMPIDTLSGGYQMRVKLAAMIAKEPNLILLDEPTNYLDLATIILLENFIKEYRGSVVLISHDRQFIKKTCDHTIEVEHGEISLFPRPLEEYLEHKQVSREQKEKYNEKIEKQRAHMQEFVDRFRAQAAKAAQAQSKLKAISKLETIEIKNALPTISITLPKTMQTHGMALRINDMDVGYGDTTVARGLSVDIEKGEHVAILGNNGQGKSTLIKTIAGIIPQTRGAYRWTPALSVGYFGAELMAKMKPDETVHTYLRKQAATGVTYEDVLRMASNFLFRDDELEKKIGVLSGGEKARLGLAGLLLTKYDVLLLDEPTNHLDFETVEGLAFALAECDRTVIFISHDKTFVSIVANKLIYIANNKISQYIGSYQEYVDELTAEVVATTFKQAPKKIKTISEEDEAEIERKRELKLQMTDLEH